MSMEPDEEIVAGRHPETRDLPVLGSLAKPDPDPSEHDVALLTALAKPDPYLDLLIGQADAGAGAAVGVLANGMTMYGRIAPDRDMGERFDRFIEGVIQRGARTSDDPDAWAEFAKKVRGQAVLAEEERANERREIVLSGEEDSDPHPAQVSAQETRRQIDLFSRRPALTLMEARVMIPGQQQSVEVPVLRVRVAQVAAWWLLEEGEDAAASVQHPTR